MTTGSSLTEWSAARTSNELDQIFSSDLFRAPQGMSIHVGVNFLDEAHYGGAFPLTACVNDARDFRDIAQTLGYEPILLTNNDATTANFTAAIRQAVANFFSGDQLFVTFSGHGSQVANTSADEEADLLDETLCFYDRMLIDDELYALLAELRPGVNVTMVYDSCHSATVSRMIAAEDPAKIRIETTKSIELRALPIDPDEVAGAGDSEKRFVPFNPKKLDKALKGDQVDQPVPKGLAKETLDAVVDLVLETSRDRETGVSKSIAFFSGI